MKRPSESFYEWLEANYPWTDEFRYIVREFRDFDTNEWRVLYRHIYN